MSDKEIEDFLFERLSGVTREAVEEHLLVCQLCLRRVEEEEEYVQTVRTAARSMETEQLEAAFRDPEPQPRKTPTWGWPRWGLVLSAAAALIIIVWVQYRPAPVMTEAEIALSMERSAPGDAPDARAGQALHLTPDLTGLPSGTELLWAIVDSGGQTVDQASFRLAPGSPGIKLPHGLKTGRYWIRIRKPGGELVREYALRIG